MYVNIIIQTTLPRHTLAGCSDGFLFGYFAPSFAVDILAYTQSENSSISFLSSIGGTDTCLPVLLRIFLFS